MNHSSLDTKAQIDSKVIEILRALHQAAPADKMVGPILAARDEVLARYQPVFNPASIPSLTADRFHEFLLFRNNKHWSGLHRMGPAIVNDMDALRAALSELLDESIPIATRMDSLLPNGKALVFKLGKAVLTAILLIVYPERYGVWNGTSEGALRQLGLWPGFNPGTTLGHRYETINSLFNDIATELGIDLWTLDALWWSVVSETPEPDDAEAQTPDEQESGTLHFGLERHLHDFLLDNWDNLELSSEWALDEDGGDIKGYGYERPTPVGRIDLLARHRTEPRWMVIELKRAQTSDETLGQVQRYMGWVQAELAEEDDQVEGLIIAQAMSGRLEYALKVARDVRFMRYEVDFRLLGGGCS